MSEDAPGSARQRKFPARGDAAAAVAATLSIFVAARFTPNAIMGIVVFAVLYTTMRVLADRYFVDPGSE